MIRRMLSSSTMATIARQLRSVQDRIKAASSKRPQDLPKMEPRLVAVGKTKPVDLIIEAYEAGQRNFGENYVMELHEKATDIELQDRCEDIRWHFIGHLQRNKISKVLDVPNLYVVESVDSQKLAKSLNDAWARLQNETPLNVMAQCNTSREENKSGCNPEEMVQLVKFISEECPRLHLMGLMTIGSYDNYSGGPNPDFQALASLREDVCKSLNIPAKDLELSMGMSGDFEQAIEMGSTNVRIGSTIFGARAMKPKSESVGEIKDSGKGEGSAVKAEDASGPVKDVTQQMSENSIS